jgi:hypothetical protein
VGKTTGWKAGRCRHVQVSELFSMGKWDQTVMDFLAATDVGKFPPKRVEEWGSSGVFSSVVSLFGSYVFIKLLPFAFAFFCQRGRRVAVVELRHLAGLPGGVVD